MAPPTMTSLDDVSKPPPGVVQPPKEIRSIIERTAGYTARNGAAFEERIRAKESANAKFSFLNEVDEYHSYYQWRLSEIKQGRGTDVAAGRVGENGTGPKGPEKPKGPPEPPEFQFSARMPTISAQDLEVLRLTALFVAKNGRSWMTALSQRESGNYQFDFLRPNHSFYQYFSRLVDQYSDLIYQSSADGGRKEKARIQQLKLNQTDRHQILDRAKNRAAYQKYVETQKAKKEEEEEKEKVAYAQIDWHDFAVVEEVLFTDADESAELPPPTSMNDLQSASLEQKASMTLQPANMRIEEAMPTDDMFQYPAPPVQAPMQPPAPYGIPGMQPTPMTGIQPSPMPMHAPQIPVGYNSIQQPPEEDEEERRIRERVENRERAQQAQASARGQGQGQIKVRTDYVPAFQQKKEQTAKSMCPVCKQLVANNEFDEHVRIEMLDPYWREQKAKAESRYSTTNLNTSDVANNLKRLASQRSDLFDPVTGQQYSEEEQAKRRKQATFQYDGTPETRDAMRNQSVTQSMKVEEQLKQLNAKYKQSG
ncbi:hypothetical protein EJ05DRAFT_538687 [Pseudovirgaria hyperparasitica]|uniref:SURP motif domain-containing protein n=1 Tax=Pseudovirgaria hyperparasitica TaxID=470096 RepID=A0A6A6W7E4_9PEZI|nr:uncharacterized protein EJ05DRAFT_538687 [Pseudovirgaria hyperparasitica]KAF2757497.1 hypothetical protein EJ05DRAFT_538687 [Pseudovirgaria hyperparasitica]